MITIYQCIVEMQLTIIKPVAGSQSMTCRIACNRIIVELTILEEYSTTFFTFAGISCRIYFKFYFILGKASIIHLA